MEAGRINLSSTSSLSSLQQHSFQQIYDTPPIVVALPTTRGGDASALRISNVTTTGFRMSPVEPNSEDGPHASMTVAYIAIEAGTHSLPNGEVIEAGRISTREQQYNGIPSGQKGWESLGFSRSFSNPILLADIQTTNNESNGIPRRSSSPWLTVAISVTPEPTSLWSAARSSIAAQAVTIALMPWATTKALAISSWIARWQVTFAPMAIS